MPSGLLRGSRRDRGRNGISLRTLMISKFTIRRSKTGVCIHSTVRR
jgi:hypothetical protein